MYVPRTVAKALYSKIGGKERGTTGEFVVPCSATFSTLAFSFGGVAYGVPLSDLYLGYAEAGNKVDCIIGIMGVDQTNAEGKPVAILGAGFLRVNCSLISWSHLSRADLGSQQSVYTVLSYSQNGAPAVGFAISAGTTALSSSSSPSSSGKSSPSPAFVPTAVAVVTSVPVDSAVVYKPETSAAAFGGAGGAAKVAVSGSATAGVAGWVLSHLSKISPDVLPAEDSLSRCSLRATSRPRPEHLPPPPRPPIPRRPPPPPSLPLSQLSSPNLPPRSRPKTRPRLRSREPVASRSAVVFSSAFSRSLSKALVVSPSRIISHRHYRFEALQDGNIDLPILMERAASALRSRTFAEIERSGQTRDEH